MNSPLLILLVAVSLAASFLFSGMEAGVLALNRLRIRQLARKGQRRAQLLHEFLEKPEHFLWTILVGNTLANLIVVSLLVLFLIQQMDQHPALFWTAFLCAVFLLYAFCDLLPKMLFRAFPNRLTLWLARPYRFCDTVLWPLTRVVEWFAGGLARWSSQGQSAVSLFGNRDELRLMMKESSQELSREERAMINRVLELQNIRVSQIAVPLEQTLTLTTDTPMRKVMELWEEKKISRLPVWSGDGDRRRIAGIISLRSVLYREDLQPERTAGQYLKPALYLGEDTRLETAMSRFQRSGERLAIVLSRTGQEIGIVSLEDILKTIFGEVRL